MLKVIPGDILKNTDLPKPFQYGLQGGMIQHLLEAG
jgi:hypothetical protein